MRVQRGNIFVMEGGDVVLLDCGQVKQFSTKQRLQFASLLVLVHRWEQLSKSVARDVDDAQTTTQREKQLQLCELTTQLAKTVKDFGMITICFIDSSLIY